MSDHLTLLKILVLFDKHGKGYNGYCYNVTILCIVIYYIVYDKMLKYIVSEKLK